MSPVEMLVFSFRCDALLCVLFAIEPLRFFCRLCFLCDIFSLLRPAGYIHLFLYTYGMHRNDEDSEVWLNFQKLSVRHCESDGMIRQ